MASFIALVNLAVLYLLHLMLILCSVFLQKHKLMVSESDIRNIEAQGISGKGFIMSDSSRELE